MTNDEFAREKKYRAALYIAKEMLNNGIITAEDFSKSKAFLISKFNPFFAKIC